MILLTLLGIASIFYLIFSILRFIFGIRPGASRQERRKEGEVSIDYVPPRKDMKGARPSDKANEGDYVDFEKVD
ncbi:MAG: hypothetical protein K2H68_02405 [Bacteroidales bacterium]|nr:hypothetical protein [Bacteroidales bacterium]